VILAILLNSKACDSARRRVARAEFGNDCCLLRCSGRHVGREERAELALIVESLRAGGDEEEDEEEKEAVVDGT
jgi:hypothetical protein